MDSGDAKLCVAAIDAVPRWTRGERCAGGVVTVLRGPGQAPKRLGADITLGALDSMLRDDSVIWVTLDGLSTCKVLSALGCSLPARMVDVSVEAARTANGRVPSPTHDYGLALVYAGVPDGHILVANGSRTASPPSEQDSNAAQSGVTCLAVARRLEVCHELVDKLVSPSTVGAACERGRYLADLARVAERGLPVDTNALAAIAPRASELARAAVADLAPAPDGRPWYEEGQDGWPRLRLAYLQRVAAQVREWPRSHSGTPELDNDTIEAMGRIAVPSLRGLPDARRLADFFAHVAIPVGRDGRHRFDPRPFRSSTGRNQPRFSECILAASKWVRHLVTPGAGSVIIIADYKAQEVGIAAAKSGDRRLAAAYRTNDAYIAVGIALGLMPDGATKLTHPQDRQVVKQLMLAVFYGAGPHFVACRTGKTPAEARELLDRFAKEYAGFWAWRDEQLGLARCRGYLETDSGWRVLTPEGSNPRSHVNFPLQAAGADLLRLVTIKLEAEGVEVIGLVHDAFIVQADVAHAESAAMAVERIMRDASTELLGSVTLSAETKTIWPGGRWCEPDREHLWQWVAQRVGVAGDQLGKQPAPEGPADPQQSGHG